MVIGYLCTFFGEVFIGVLCPYYYFLIGLFTCCWFLAILFILWMLIPYHIWFSNIFSNYICFHIIDGTLSSTRVFHCDGIQFISSILLHDHLCFWCHIKETTTYLIQGYRDYLYFFYYEFYRFSSYI